MQIKYCGAFAIGTLLLGCSESDSLPKINPPQVVKSNSINPTPEKPIIKLEPPIAGNAAAPKPVEEDIPITPIKVVPPRFVEIEKSIAVKFERENYTFSLAEVAKGIQINYTVQVLTDIPDVVPSDQTDGNCGRALPSGLFPFEWIKGGEQSYCIRQTGLCAPKSREPRVIKQGEYKHSFEWDGKNWDGPSDTGNRKGPPFPTGTYEIEISFRGYQETQKGQEPYWIKKTIAIILTP